ncbi:PP2C family protein-serine/threonine phosphatase [Massilia horti]|nr:protein phosphatase 2C domain-containing protein [Massilia horti]
MIPSDQLQFGPGLDVAVRCALGVGPVMRAENQDNYLLIDVDGKAAFLRDERPKRATVPGWPHGHARLAVLDGMGGHGHGREAAEAVVEGLLSMPACVTAAALALHLDALHAQLQRQFDSATPTGLRPGTTLTMLELIPGQDALLYHVGDSRLYEIRGRHATPLTVDHVPATAHAMAALIGEHAWRQQVYGEHQPQISQAFILGNSLANPALLADALFELTPINLPPWLRQLGDRRPLALRAGSIYLLATDGFWSCAKPEPWVAQWPRLVARCRSAGAVADALFAELANNPPPGLQPDNLTAIVLRVN